MIDVSIIIPVYGVENYIRRCLESVISQECDSVQIECIIVDDCSPDGSLSIIEQMQLGYQGLIEFQIVKHECNRGLSAARNTGLRAAKGDNILFLDSDDYLLPHAIECLVDSKRNYPEADVVMGNMFNSYQGKAAIPEGGKEVLLKGREKISRGLSIITAWNKLVNRQFLLDNDLFFIEGIMFEDIPWTYDLLSHVDSLLILPTITYYYEYNETSIMNTIQDRPDQAAKSWAKIVRHYLDHPYPSLYVEQRQFVLGFLLNAIDICNKCTICEETHRFVSDVKKQLLFSTLKDGRIMMSLYMYLILDLFHGVFQFRFFRTHYDKINNIATQFFRLTNVFHK